MNVAGVARSRVRMVSHAWRRGRRMQGTITFALVLALTGLAGAGFSSLFGAAAAAGISAASTTDVLALVLSAAVVGVLVFDLHHAVATVLADSDLGLLRRAPLRARALLAIKLVDALPRTTLLLVVVALPALITWAERFPVGPAGLSLIPFHVAALWALPLGIGVAAATLLLRAVPARRAREAMGLLSTVVLAVFWLVNAFVVPRLAAAPADLGAMIGAGGFRGAVQLLSPGHIVARALLAAHVGHAALAAALTAWLLALALGALGLAGIAVARFASALHGELEVSPRRRVQRRRASSRMPAPAAGTTASAEPWARRLRAIVRKDARLLLRDWPALGDVFTTATLWTLLPLLSTGMVISTPAFVIRAMLVALSVGLGYEIGARSVPLERHGAVWARLAPLAPGSWVGAKLAGAGMLALPLLGFAGLAVAAAFPVTGREWAAGMVAGISALAVALAIGLLAGMAYADPGWTHPRAMLRVTGRIVAVVLLLAQAAGWLALAAGPLATPAALRWAADLWLPPLLAAGLLWSLTRVGSGLMRRFDSYH